MNELDRVQPTQSGPVPRLSLCLGAPFTRGFSTDEAWSEPGQRPSDDSSGRTAAEPGTDQVTTRVSDVRHVEHAETLEEGQSLHCAVVVYKSWFPLHGVNHSGKFILN